MILLVTGGRDMSGNDGTDAAATWHRGAAAI